jgi:hypothetical protein
MSNISLFLKLYFTFKDEANQINNPYINLFIWSLLFNRVEIAKTILIKLDVICLF